MKSIAAVVILASTLPAQWTQLHSPSNPEPRANFGMVYESSSNGVLLFGGKGLLIFSDTWRWRDGSWTNLHVQGPSPRHNVAMAAVEDGALLFGGQVPYPPSNETWMFKNEQWNHVTPSSSPPPRAATAMVGIGNGNVLLFGGVTISGHVSDTWVWNGTTWTQVGPSTPAPPARSYHAMVYDGQRVILFGGWDGGTVYGDVWTWDPMSSWKEIHVSAPPARWGHAMAYDDVRQRVILFAGTDSARTQLSDIWEWDGQHGWEPADRAPPPPPSRRGHGMVWIPESGKSMAFGGVTDFFGSSPIGDTWLYSPFPVPPEVIDLGAGCTDGNLPTLTSTPAWIGESVEMVLSGIGSGGLGFGAILFAGFEQPMIDLSTLGMFGCTAYTNAQVAIHLVPVAGIATWQMAEVPYDSNLVGLEVFFQGLVLRPGVNPFGGVVSNGVALTVGSR